MILEHLHATIRKGSGFRRHARIPLCVALLAVLLSACGPATDPGAQSGDAGMATPSVAETQAIFEEAFVYGFPLVLNYKFFRDTFIDPSSRGYKGPLNQIHSEARVYTYRDTTVQTPNSDTPYSMVGMDLRAEPLVLCMPEIEEGRFYNVQLVDMYTFNYGYMGSRTTGTGAGCFLVAGPDWSGETPPGIGQAFSSESPFGMAIYRTQLFGPDDLDNVAAVQSGYRVEPLSAFLDQPAPAAAPAIDWPAAGPEVFSTGFPATLDFVLQFLPPTGPAAVEEPLRAQLASVGIGRDKRVAFEDLSAEHQAAAAQGVGAGAAKVGEAAAGIGTTVNGWQIGSAAGSRAFYDGNWLLRAAGARAGIYGNDREEATYPYARSDADGEPLDGSKYNYTLTFSADRMPPVNAFWSITIYDGDTQFLIENPIDRYLINSPMLPDLKKEADGSLTIYIQRDSPGADNESNWLPGPDGPIFLVMRLYWPRDTPPSVLPPGQGTWQPPRLVRTAR